MTVNAIDSDMTLQSSDDVLFKVHHANLEMHSQVFADAASTTSSTGSREGPRKSEHIVPLTEPSNVLELMLQYTYLQRQPDLSSVPFELLSELAEAVEKYELYCAMGVCSVRMRTHISSHPLPVLLFATRHSYPSIANEAAEFTLDIPLPTVLASVTNDVFLAWIKYHQAHLALLQKEFTRFGPVRHHKLSAASTTPKSILKTFGVPAVTSAADTPAPCDAWSHSYALITHHLGSDLRNLATLPAFLDKRLLLAGGPGGNGGGAGCEDCRRELGYWYHQSVRDRNDLKRFWAFFEPSSGKGE